MGEPGLKVLIFGAGAIGCYIGGHWSAAGLDVTFFGRSHSMDQIRQNPLYLTGDKPLTLDTEYMAFTHNLSALSKADIIVLTVKYAGLGEAISQISARCSDDVPVLCLLNGVRPLQELRAAFPDRQILGGMVPFNVVWREIGHLHRSSVGDVMAETAPIIQALSDQVADSEVPIVPVSDILPVQYGKLLLNLNNSINALSGLALYDQLVQRKFRRIYAKALEEALSVYSAAGITHAKIGPLPASWIVRVLRAPDLLFNTLVTRIQKIDRESRASMAADLDNGRPTEIAILNGEIVDLARRAGVPAPVNKALVHLIEAAQSGGKRMFSAEALEKAISGHGSSNTGVRD